MKSTVTFADPERATVDLLGTWYSSPDATAGVGVPPERQVPANPAPVDYIQVGWDGTPRQSEQIMTALVRVTTWAASTTRAKALALEAQGRLLGYEGGTVISNIERGIGIIPGRDPITHAELASFSVLVTLRSTPLT